MTREELNFKCVEILDQAVRGGAGSAGVRLATLLRELTGKTPEPPAKTRGMEIAEKMVRQESPKTIAFISTDKDLDPLEIDGSPLTCELVKSYIADAIDATEPQCKLPVIEWESEGGITSHFIRGLYFSRSQAACIAFSHGFDLADYPNLKERK